ncbi:MAG: dipeptide epimerase [Candidatus Bathyarchaeota archaeon]|nr:dipeptide epimerase [Candidatus Bathyarchaeota archaeon]MDH5780586.1 dipeptide epimerase [Candidatus Bathyarchaeota archaeon]
MAIQSIEAYSVVLRYREPFRIAPSTTVESHNVIVKVVTDFGVIGIGESSPSERVTHETPQTVIETLDEIAPNLIGMCPLRIEQISETMDELVAENPSAKAAIDIALHDILGKVARKPLFKLIGGFREAILTDLTLGIKEPEEMASDAVKAVKRGFKAFKVKVGVNPLEDFERIQKIREAIGSEIAIRIDANQGWTVNEAVTLLKRLEAFEIEFVEQPIKGDDIQGLAAIREASQIPLMADESVHTPEDALHLIKENAVDMINIKLMKSGGILKAKKIAVIAEAANVPCMIGCMGESTVGITAGVHLAAALKNIQYADLDSDILIADKLVSKGGAELVASQRIPSMKPGLGIIKLKEELLGNPLRVYK